MDGIGIVMTKPVLIGALAGGLGAALLLAVFWRPPAKAKD